jgi:hypothetical protein
LQAPWLPPRILREEPDEKKLGAIRLLSIPNVSFPASRGSFSANYLALSYDNYVTRSRRQTCPTPPDQPGLTAPKNRNVCPLIQWASQSRSTCFPVAGHSLKPCLSFIAKVLYLAV